MSKTLIESFKASGRPSKTDPLRISALQREVLILINDNPSHSSSTDIIEQLNNGREEPVNDAQIYVMFSRFKKRKMIKEMPQQKDGLNEEFTKRSRGRPKIYYKLTELGLKAIQAKQITLAQQSAQANIIES